jgi:hypothetical protein
MTVGRAFLVWLLLFVAMLFQPLSSPVPAIDEISCCICNGGTCATQPTCVADLAVTSGFGIASCTAACQTQCGSPGLEYKEGVSCKELAICGAARAPALSWSALTLCAVVLGLFAFRRVQRRPTSAAH